MEDISATERKRLDNLARRIGKQYGDAVAAGHSEETLRRLKGQYERLVEKLGYDPLI